MVGIGSLIASTHGTTCVKGCLNWYIRRLLACIKAPLNTTALSTAAHSKRWNFEKIRLFLYCNINRHLQLEPLYPWPVAVFYYLFSHSFVCRVRETRGKAFHYSFYCIKLFHTKKLTIFWKVSGRNGIIKLRKGEYANVKKDLNVLKSKGSARIAIIRFL